MTGKTNTCSVCLHCLAATIGRPGLAAEIDETAGLSIGDRVGMKALATPMYETSMIMPAFVIVEDENILLLEA